MNTSQKIQPRKKYLVNKRTQFRLLGWIFLVGIGLVAIAAMSVLFYYLNVCRMIESAEPSLKAGGLRPCPIILGLFTWLLLTLLAWISFRLTHRIAGPAYKFQQVIQSITAGNYDIPQIRLRKEDELLELAESLNSMLDSLRSRREKYNRIKGSLDQNLENLAQILEEKKELSQVKQSLEQLRKACSEFKDIS